MKAVVIKEYGNAEKLEMIDVPTPRPESHEVKIHIHYSGVNPVDWKIREGMLQKVFPCEFPLIPGWDAAGIVEEVGSDVTEFQVGDEVYTYCRKPIVQWGTYAQYVCFDSRFVAPKPKNISFAQAAAIPLTGLTAWQAVFDQLKLHPHETILIHAGAGGVGGFAIEFAKLAGATVITTSSSANHPYVKELGADMAIDYHTQDFDQVVRTAYPNGIDAVLDTVGGATLQNSFRLLKPGGRLLSIVEPIRTEHPGIEAKFMLVQPNGEQLREIGRLIEEGKISPPQIEEMPLENAPQAQQKSEAGHTRGKIVLRVI